MKKITSQKIKLFRIVYLASFLMLVNPFSSNAQNFEAYLPKLLSPTKGGNETYLRYDVSSGERRRIFYCNSKYNENEWRAAYPLLGPFSEGNFRLNIKSNSTFVRAVKESFSPDKYRLLLERNERWYFSFVISHKGEVLQITFVLNEDSYVTPDELALLEENLVQLVQFETYDVNLPGNASRSIEIFFNLSEVEKGCIHDVVIYDRAYQQNQEKENP